MIAKTSEPAVASTDLPAIAGGRPAKTTPLADEKRYGPDDLRELKEALDQETLFYVKGKKVKQFEEEFAAMMGFKYGVASSSGTATIHSALMAAGISPGDEVIVPPITDLGSIVPILWQNAVPVFADVDPHTYNLSPASVEEKITQRTRAILAVHLAGNACDMDALGAIAQRHGILLIEDCAQSNGCLYKGKAIGHYSLGGCFSFNEYKHVACGDGGVLLTNDLAFARRARLATDKCYNRQPGAEVRSPVFLANNYRMTELQGAVGRAQIRRLAGVVKRRRDWGNELLKRLAGLEGISLPRVTPGCESSWGSFIIRIEPDKLGVTADEFAKALAAEGISAGAHFIPQPVYLYPIFANHSAFERGTHSFCSQPYHRGLCPTAEAVIETCVALRVNEGYTELDLDECAHAVTRLVRWYASKMG